MTAASPADESPVRLTPTSPVALIEIDNQPVNATSQAVRAGLLVAIQQDRFRFAAGLDEQPAMTKAMLSYRRQVREDGLIGSELVVALLLAITPPPPPAVTPWVVWGPPAFS